MWGSGTSNHSCLAGLSLQAVFWSPSRCGVAADTVALVYNGGSVTPVTIDSFAAAPQGAGVLLEWNCVSEFSMCSLQAALAYRETRCACSKTVVSSTPPPCKLSRGR